MKRPLRARVTTELAVAAVTITDLTAPQLTGLEARTFREVVSRERIPHARVGQRIIVRADVWLDAIDRMAARDAEDGAAEPVASRSGVDRVLALVGREIGRGS